MSAPRVLTELEISLFKRLLDALFEQNASVPDLSKSRGNASLTSVAQKK